jgi:hypothetical protein
MREALIHPRVRYWTETEARRNFGDALSALLCEQALLAPVIEADRYRLLGSCIDTAILQRDIEDCAASPWPRLVLWGCGKRDESPLDDRVRAHCHFLGVRGPLTRDALGLGVDTPIGDPALLLPLLRPRGPVHGRRLAVPHFNEPGDITLLSRHAGADQLVSPAVADLAEVERLVDEISGASFVLCGALHAAIVACAYDVPFAFWDTGFIDIPFKWHDFAASVGVRAEFVADVASGEAWFASQREVLRRPPLAPLVGSSPFATRAGLLLGACLSDALLSDPDVSAVQPLLVAAQACEVAQRVVQQAARALEPDKAPRNETGLQRLASDLRESEHALRTAAEQARIEAARITARLALETFCFDDGVHDMRFALGSAGMACLGAGWTTPNEVGPWAVCRDAVLRLPASTRWWAFSRLDFGLLVFAPQAAPLQGRRGIDVWCNDALLWHHEVLNDTAESVVYSGCPVALPEVLRRRGGDLVLRFGVAALHSPRELGLGDDERTLVFALSTLKAFK